MIRLRGFKIYQSRGKWYCYHRATGKRVHSPIGSAEFFAECAKIAEAAKKIEAVIAKQATLGALITAYRAHRAFQDLAPQTQSDYQKVLNYLRPIAGEPLSRFERPLVVGIRDKADASKGRRFANYVKAVLSILFAWGAERGYLKENPASGIKDIRRPRGLPDANRPWSDEEREAVLQSAPPHMLPAIAVMMFTGLGPKDALLLPRNYWRNGEIATQRSKTGEPVFWPIPEALDPILAGAPTHNAVTLCASSKGLPWTISGFRASWRTLRLRLEREGRIGPGLTLYGLRHTVAVILRGAGRGERDIADALGQKTVEMARHYSKGADLRGKMRGVVKDFNAELAKRKNGK